MKIKRVYNNNIVLAEESDGNEMVLMGRGIGFKLSRGDDVDKSLIEKKFELKDEEGYRFMKIVEDIPEDIIKVADELITYIKSQLSMDISDGIYVTLTDHIVNLLERVRMGIQFDESLLWNVKQLYPSEYKVARECVRIISKEFNITVDYGDTNFIALHIINAEVNSEMSDVYTITDLIYKINNIVIDKYHFIDKESYTFERFMIHCRLFSRNVVLNKIAAKTSKSNKEMFGIMLNKYESQAACLVEIKEMLDKDYNYNLSDDESLYLLLHIIKLTT